MAGIDPLRLTLDKKANKGINSSGSISTGYLAWKIHFLCCTEQLEKILSSLP